MLDNVRLENNRAAQGGAVFLDFSADERRSAVFRDTFFSDNAATAGDGGALGMVVQAGVRHDIEIIRSTFADNSAADAGGALDLHGFGQVRLINSTFVGNTATQGGVAIDLSDYAGTANIISATLVDNHGPVPINLGDLPEDDSVALGNVTLSNSIVAGDSSVCSLGPRRLSRSVYNLFSGAVDPSCVPSANSANVENDAAPRADIVAALNGGVLVQADEAAEEDWFLPHLPITDLDYPLILDAGNPANLVAGAGSADACRSTDVRGHSRSAGESCDRGAFEYQTPTALENQGNNSNRRTRTVRLDVLANDIAGEEGMALRPGTLRLLPFACADDPAVCEDNDWRDTVGDAFVRQRHEDPTDDESLVLQYDDVIQALSDGGEFEHRMADIDDPVRECGIGTNLDGSQNNADAADPDALRDDNCVVVYRFRQPTPMVTCSALPFEDRFRYEVDVDSYTLVTDPDTDEEQRIWDNDPRTISAEVIVTIHNVPPLVPRQRISRRIEHGDDVTINLLDEGVRASDFRITSMRLRDNAWPLFARRALDNSVEGTGIIFDLENLTVTYRHGALSSSFTDIFTVQLRDECGDTSDVHFEITFPQQSASGGEMVGSGHMLLPLLLGLLGLRRRF